MSQLLNEVSNESDAREVRCGEGSEVYEVKCGGIASEVNEGRWIKSDEYSPGPNYRGDNKVGVYNFF